MSERGSGTPSPRGLRIPSGDPPPERGLSYRLRAGPAGREDQRPVLASSQQVPPDPAVVEAEAQRQTEAEQRHGPQDRPPREARQVRLQRTPPRNGVRRRPRQPGGLGGRVPRQIPGFASPSLDGFALDGTDLEQRTPLLWMNVSPVPVGDNGPLVLMGYRSCRPATEPSPAVRQKTPEKQQDRRFRRSCQCSGRYAPELELPAAPGLEDEAGTSDGQQGDQDTHGRSHDSAAHQKSHRIPAPSDNAVAAKATTTSVKRARFAFTADTSRLRSPRRQLR